MLKVFEVIVYFGKEGLFEFVDMVWWFLVLFVEMKKIGIMGQDLVMQFGVMFQVQMKIVGSLDEVVNNLKNWFLKIGLGEIECNYVKVGVDYQVKMCEVIGKGWLMFEVLFVFVCVYIECVDFVKVKQFVVVVKQFNLEMDFVKCQMQMVVFVEMMKIGDLFNDMQVKVVLMVYMQNVELYLNLKCNVQQVSGEIQKDLEVCWEMFKQIWSEVGQ